MWATNMATVQAVHRSRFMETLTIPWMDKTIALIAITPNVVELYHRYTDTNLTFVRAVAGTQTIILVITMVFRRAPVRVTPKPWYWLLAFVATYGLIAFYAFAPRGAPVSAVIVPNVLVLVSVVIIIWARASLGRSIGYVPADRGIVTDGPYKFVRHPIYSGLFITMFAFLLRAYSPLNLLLTLVIVGLFMIKSVIEERFLHDNPRYAAYMTQVRHRWIPGVA
jgi:protein-S-isoprenylcysteine O-methyltransferase Ste14